MRNSIIFSKKSFGYIIISLVWLAVWEMASLTVNNGILLVGPVDVVKALYTKVLTLNFYISICNSMFRIGSGFFAGLFIGLLFAILAWKCRFFEEFINPVLAFMKAAPVASFIVLFLIWWSSKVLSAAIAICVVLPQVYVAVLKGLQETDRNLEEMAQVFDVHPVDRLNYIYRPAVSGYMESAIRISASMAWKAGVAAEVIGTPDNTLGNSLYMSKIYLDTAGVLAYTVVIILLSIICENVLLLLYKKYNEYEFKCVGSARKKSNSKTDICNELVIDNISKNYGELDVLSNYSQKLKKGEKVVFDWPSGAGKTTLFRIIAGLDSDYNGSIIPKEYSVSMLFQEDRLVEEHSALINAELVCGDRERAMCMLKKLLPSEDINKPVKLLSGGQKRRVAIARACLVDADIALFDEPYEGLDVDNRRSVKEVLNEYGRDKIVLMASHIKD